MSFDPAHCLVTKEEAAKILGMSIPKFDRLRKEDNRCPLGVPSGDGTISKVLFRLSEVYTYSDQLYQDGLDRLTKKKEQLATS